MESVKAESRVREDPYLQKKYQANYLKDLALPQVLLLELGCHIVYLSDYK